MATRIALQLMGILNVTPDSFSDGGCWTTLDKAIDHAANLHRAGANLIDVGGESTRPGAKPISACEEIERVIPAIKAIKARFPVKISIDTYKPETMEAAIKAGATMVNDVFALRQPGAIDCLVRHPQVDVVLMHMQSTPQTMQNAPTYQDVVLEVSQFLQSRMAACTAAGISKNRIYLDPGIGFGKTHDHNLSLMKHLKSLLKLKCPLLVGVSRKKTVRLNANGTHSTVLAGSLAAGLWCALQGASILRVHDVQETAAALTLWNQIESAAPVS